MKTNIKRLIAVLLCALITSSLLPGISVPASAIAAWDDEGETGEVAWHLKNGVLTIFGEGAMADYSYKDQSPWEGRLVITRVVIEDGVTHIGSRAFGGCTGITELSIADTVESIGKDAFNYCKNLTELTIPSSVTTIGESAFHECFSLSTLEIPSSVTSIGDLAFELCTGLTTLTVDAQIVGRCAFNKCSSLTTLTLGDSVRTLNDGAFMNCTNLINLDLGHGVETIGPDAFYNCSSLEELTVPSNVTHLSGAEEFCKCSSLKNVTVEANIDELCGSTFTNCGSIENLTVGGGVKSIRYNAFDGLRSLKTVTIGGKDTEIQDCTFRNCTNLTSVTINGAETIANQAFADCTSLTDVTIGEGMKTIVLRAFYNCTSLSHVHIPASTTEIMVRAFEGCTSLSYLCSPVSDGAAAAYCADNNITFRICGLDVTLNETTGGAISADKTEDLTQGETVTLNATPDEIYLVPVITVTDANGDPVDVTDGSFIMPDCDVTVSTEFCIPYIDENGALQKLTEDVTVLTPECDVLADGWNLVLEDTTLTGRITAGEDSHLLIYDGATLTAPGGIEVPSSASLTIWAQSTGENMGALVAEVSSYSVIAIGSSSGAGAITVNGGRIVARGGDDAASIGSRNRTGGLITINGGDITAESRGSYGAGVNVASAGFVMNGGTLVATGGKYGAGIGAGYMNSCGPITINGGTVTATSESARGIGPYSDSDTVITINGGKITAKSIGGAGKKAVLSVGWSDETDFVEARLLGNITWTKHFATADAPAEFYNDTTMASSMRLVPIEGHPDLTHIDETVPTCTGEGCVEYWICDVCGKCFADAEGTTEVDPVLPMIAHNPVYVEDTEPDGAAAGCIAHYECEYCGAFFADAQCAEPLSRDLVLRIPYIDETGNYSVLEPGEYSMLDSYIEANLINGSVTLGSGRYVLEGDFCKEYGVTVGKNCDAKIVLCDGALFSFPTNAAFYCLTVSNGATLSFFAQSSGDEAGAFGVERNHIDLNNAATLNIYGGRFTVGSDDNGFIFTGLCGYSNDASTSAIRIFGGEITAMSTSNVISIGSSKGGTVEILGGVVNASSSVCAATINLGWTNVSDRISAGAYKGTVTFVKNFVFDDGENVTIATPENSAGHTLIPRADVVFDSNGGDGNMDDGASYIGAGFILPDCAFGAPEHMEFAAWSYNGELYAPGETVIITDSAVTVTATWQAAHYPVSFLNHDGAELASISVEYGTAPVYAGNTPACPGEGALSWAFNGWTDGENVYAVDAGLPAVAGPIAYTAVYKLVGGETGEVTWRLEGGTLTIRGDGAMADYSYENQSPWEGRLDITTVVIEYGVTHIGDNAFCSCKGLESVIIPEGVGCISSYAFCSCTSLKSVTIPDSVTTIGEFAFSECSSLKSIDIPEGVTVIERAAFSLCTSLESIVIPASVELIGDDAFKNYGDEDITLYSPVRYGAAQMYAANNDNATFVFKGYTITYTDINGDALQTITDVEHGAATPGYSGETPTRDSGAYCLVYTFAGWEPALADAVTGDATYRPTFTESYRHDFFHQEAYAATCTKYGTEEYFLCLNCLKMFADEDGINEINLFDTMIEPLGHDLIHYDAIEPTCEDFGLIEFYRCDRCSKFYTDAAAQHEIRSQDVNVNPLGHDMTHYEAKDPTCTESGRTDYYFCERCGRYYTDSMGFNETDADAVMIPPLGHDCVDTVIEPDCTDRGYTKHKCSRCGEVYKDTYVDALGHDLTHYDAIEPTCTEFGSTEYYYCERCHNSFSDAQAQHTADYLNMIIYPLGHYMTHYEAKDPTCTESGLTEYYFCERCGKYFTDRLGLNETDADAVVIAPIGHIFGEWTQTSAPTCTDAGEKTRTCSRCDETETQSVEALGHDYEKIETIDPTCTTDGYSVYKCSRCPDSYYDDFTDALGHDFGEWTITTATCTEAGEETRYCSRCDATETKALDAPGHDYVAVVTEPTCTEQGYTTYTCSKCGDNYVDDQTDPVGHTPDAGTVTVKPTYSEKGVRTYECTVCHATWTEEIPVLPALPGDVNGDGKVNTRDIAQLKKYISNAITEEDIVFGNSDINGDGKVNTKDLSAVKRIVAQ
ncbi:MAG: leucine-rich repeat protein [Clostridia bacterium]|nr:leucine-rich repeat protein [Clostridia bacterium]